MPKFACKRNPLLTLILDLYNIDYIMHGLYVPCLQLKISVFKLEMEMVYQAFRTTEEVELRGTESHGDIKPSFLATSSSVMEFVGTSQSGEWMSTLEVVDIRIDTLLIFKSGDHHPLWMTPLALVNTAWLETTGLLLSL